MAEYRQWREEKRTPLKDVVPLDTPYNILIETSSLCNINCRYCAHSQHLPDIYEGNMSMELFQHIMRDVHEFPSRVKLFEMFYFGEPLCNPDLAEMISIAKKEDVVDNIAFTTNGLLFTRDRADEIISSGVDTIRISLQGIDSESYLKTCGININFNEFVENLKYLYDHRGKCKIRMKIADISLKNEPDGEYKFKQIFGPIADSIYIEHIIPIFQSIDYNEIDSNIYKNAINGRENVKQKKINKVCHRPFYRLRVASNGIVSVSCCDTPHDIILGDINNESLADIWNGEKHTKLLKMQLEGRRFEIPVCKKCTQPNDITNEADILDPWAKDILKRFK